MINALGSSWACGELRLRTQYGGASATTGGTPIGTLTNPANAFDGSLATSTGSSSAIGSWVGYDFGSAVSIVEFEFVAPTSGTNLATFAIDHSVDGNTWVAEAIYGSTGSWPASTSLSRPINQVETPTGLLDKPILGTGVTYALTSQLAGLGLYGRVAPQDMAYTSGGLGQPYAGTISAFVRDAGQPVPSAYVRLHSRISGVVVGGGMTDASGFISFSGLNQTINDYYAVAFDPDGGEVYNALIFDRIQPS